jgi:hypothetical protein
MGSCGWSVILLACLHAAASASVRPSDAPSLSISSSASAPSGMGYELYFGRSIESQNGTIVGAVTDAAFDGFLEDEVTPLLPDGFSWWDVHGQYMDQSHGVVRERSTVIKAFVITAENDAMRKFETIADEYAKRFDQEAVLMAIDGSVRTCLLGHSGNEQSVKDCSEAVLSRTIRSIAMGRQAHASAELSHDSEQRVVRSDTRDRRSGTT